MPARRLESANRFYTRQQRLIAMAIAQARRSWSTKRYAGLLALLFLLQRENSQNSLDYMPDLLEELGIDAPATASPNPQTLVGWSSAGAPLQNYVEAAPSLPMLQQLVATEIYDIGRITQQMDMVARPTIAGSIRYLNPPSCGRCTILAGRFYPYSGDFARHENCDCFMVPVDREIKASDLLTDPEAAFEAGEVKGLSKADMEAIRDGADMASVINVRSRRAGLRVSGRVLERGGRITPEGIYAVTRNRDDAIEMLTNAGYMR